MKRKLMVITGICILIILVSVASSFVRCRNRIRSITYGITFEKQQSGHYPRALVGGGQEGVSTDNPQSTREGFVSTDSEFVYLNWDRSGLDADEIQGDFPLIYDRLSVKHFGCGIHLSTVNRGVSWDFGAARLKAFIAAHPELHIPAPE